MIPFSSSLKTCPRYWEHVAILLQKKRPVRSDCEQAYHTKASKEYITKELKNELHNLHKNNHVPDLFQLQRESLMQKEEASNVLPTIVDTAVPMVVQGVMTILFADKNSSSATIEQIQSGDFSSAIKSLTSEGKLTTYDFYKWNNILKIAQKADKVSFWRIRYGSMW